MMELFLPFVLFASPSKHVRMTLLLSYYYLICQSAVEYPFMFAECSVLYKYSKVTDLSP
jgi:hypothetical protein